MKVFTLFFGLINAQDEGSGENSDIVLTTAPTEVSTNPQILTTTVAPKSEVITTVFMDFPTTIEFEEALKDENSALYQEKSALVKDFNRPVLEKAAADAGYSLVDIIVRFVESLTARRRRRQAEENGADISTFARANVEGIFRKLVSNEIELIEEDEVVEIGEKIQNEVTAEINTALQDAKIDSDAKGFLPINRDIDVTVTSQSDKQERETTTEPIVTLTPTSDTVKTIISSSVLIFMSTLILL